MSQATLILVVKCLFFWGAGPLCLHMAGAYCVSEHWQTGQKAEQYKERKTQAYLEPDTD